MNRSTIRTIGGGGLVVAIISGVIISVLDHGFISKLDSTPNRPPQISIESRDVQVGDELSITPVASDPDGDPLSFTLFEAPGWIQLDPATGRLHGRPGASDMGSVGPLKLQASDTQGHTAFALVTIRVLEPPKPACVMSEPELSTDRNGGDYKDFQSAGLPGCLEACLAEAQCKAVTLNVAANQCWMKTGVPLRRENPAFTSAVKLCHE
jgi:hypothetical protein